MPTNGNDEEAAVAHQELEQRRLAEPSPLIPVQACQEACICNARIVERLVETEVHPSTSEANLTGGYQSRYRSEAQEDKQ